MSSPSPAAAAPSANTASIRRSYTLPARIAPRPQSQPPTGSADGIETLFTCDSTKIVSFTASSASRFNSQRPAAAGSDISYRSSTERTLAVGALRIYRVTSSNVSFLNSGHLLHTIFPRSQCWCVDGEATFVLRIRQDSYYRIELPFHTDEDKQKIEELKSVLSQVLQYEKTPCPFSRPFSVELPERPKTPPRRRSMRAQGKAKKWTFDKTWMPEDGPRPSTPTPVTEGSDASAMSSCEEEDQFSPSPDPSHVIGHPAAAPPRVVLQTSSPQPSVRERAKIFQGLRSATAPLGLDGGSTPPRQQSVFSTKLQEAKDISQPADSRLRHTRILEQPEEDPKEPAETQSLVSSIESFETARPSPSPEYLDAQSELTNPWEDQLQVKSYQEEGRAAQSELTNPWEDQLQVKSYQEEERGRDRHRRQLSDITVRPKSSGRVVEAAKRTRIDTKDTITTPTNDTHSTSTPSTPQLISDSDGDSVDQLPAEIFTPPNTIRLRRLTGASQRRAFSPMPNAQNLFRPTPTRTPSKQLTNALVRKTYELILGPPAHLVSLMLSIAARISEGALRFTTFRVRHTGEKIPCSWESSDEEDWEEDDYGIPLRNLDGTTSRRRAWSGELD